MFYVILGFAYASTQEGGYGFQLRGWPLRSSSPTVREGAAGARGDAWAIATGRSPLHGAFLRCIDLCELRRIAKKKALDVIEQKILRVRVSQIETIVIDDLRLFLEPAGPAGLANLRRESLSEFIRKGSEPER